MEFLFASGKSSHAAPIKLIYMSGAEDLPFPAQAMFVVPKRLFKRAHDRNKLKRRMKEVYRLNKNNLYNTLQLKEKKVVLAFIYTGKVITDYQTIEKALLKLLSHFSK